jgi:small subunit ribosomal protein S2
MKELLEAGVHFGHQTRRWNPRMKPFIFGARNGIYIIDLQITARRFREALAFVSNVSAGGGQVLFVGTKRQAQAVIVEESVRAHQFYVEQRWLGGTLTNFSTIRKSINRLKELEELADGESMDAMTKKEVSRLEKERGRLAKSLSGIKSMERLPQAMFVVDPVREKIAVAEGNKLGIPVIAIVDTNCDPEPIDFPIPGNDDAIRAIKLFASRFADAILEGRTIWESAKREPASDDEQQVAAPAQSIADRVRARTARREKVRQQAQAGRRTPASRREAAEPVPAAADEPARAD